MVAIIKIIRLHILSKEKNDKLAGCVRGAIESWIHEASVERNNYCDEMGSSLSYIWSCEEKIDMES